MTILNLSTNSMAFIFDDLRPVQTAIYLIEGEKSLFLIDTFCGSGYLDEVRKKIASIHKPLFVINSHHHWDHVWGNCAFKDATIISHELCRSLEKSVWEEQYIQNKHHAKGDCTCTLPTLTFKDHLVFHEDGIEIFHTPGHSIDSISVYDRNHKILYTGDNLELPIVYVQQPDIDLYLHTLQNYLTMDVDKFTGSHAITVKREDFQTIFNYLNALKHNESLDFEDPYLRYVHQLNLDILNSQQWK